MKIVNYGECPNGHDLPTVFGTTQYIPICYECTIQEHLEIIKQSKNIENFEPSRPTSSDE